MLDIGSRRRSYSMADKIVQAVDASLVPFLQAFARLIARELWQQPGAQVVPVAQEPPRAHLTRRILNVKEAADVLQVKTNRVYEISYWNGPEGLRCVRIGR